MNRRILQVCASVVVLLGFFVIFSLSASAQYVAATLAAQHGQVYGGTSFPTGTVFSENPGNVTTNPAGQPCWNGGTGTAAQCQQLWNVDVGSGEQSIASAPCGGSGNAFELQSEATPIDMVTVGSFPLVPAASGFVLEVVVCYSALPSGFTTIFQTHDPAGSQQEIFLNIHTGGMESGNSSTCSAAANSFHTVIFTSNGTNITYTIDGVQCGASWSDPGKPIGSVELTGTSSGNTYFQQILLNGSTVTGGFPPSVLADWAGQSGNTVNTANLQAGTHCGNAFSGTTAGDWIVNTLTGISFSFISDGQAFPSPVTVCSSSYPGTSGVALEMSVATTASSGGTIEDVFTSDFNTTYPLFMSLYFKFTTAGNINPQGLDFAVLNAGTSFGLQIQENSGGTAYTLCGENYTGGGTAQCTTSTISPNIWYRGIIEVTPSGSNNFWLYSASGSLIQGPVAFAGTSEPNVNGSVYIYLGKTGAETMPFSATVEYSNVLVYYTKNLVTPPTP